MKAYIYLLSLLFICLKLTNYITWSWFWVVSPIIFFEGSAFIIAFVISFFVAYMLNK